MMLLTFDARRPKAQRRPPDEARDTQEPAIVAIAWELHQLDNQYAEWAARFLRGLIDKMNASGGGR